MRFLGRFNSIDATKYLKFTYMVTIALLLSAVVLTPFFIRSHLVLLKKYIIREDAVEAVFIIILLLIAYILSTIYKKELRKYRQQTHKLILDNRDLSSRLDDAFKYIGGVNVQIQQIRSIFCGLKRYPVTESIQKGSDAICPQGDGNCKRRLGNDQNYMSRKLANDERAS